MSKNIEHSILFIPVFVTALLCPGQVSAETVYLKNGKVISGKIVEKTDKYIRIESNGVRDIRFTDEIERIEETGAPVAAKTQQAAVVNAAEGEAYINKEFGFEIRGPVGWFKKDNSPYIHGATYTKYAQGKGETALPMLDINALALHRATDESLKGLNNAVDFSNVSIQSWEEARAKIIEAPHEIEVNGIKGARFVVEKVYPDGQGNKRLIKYTFLKGDVVISISCLDWLATSDENVKDFETAANNFKFIN